MVAPAQASLLYVSASTVSPVPPVARWFPCGPWEVVREQEEAQPSALWRPLRVPAPR